MGFIFGSGKKDARAQAAATEKAAASQSRSDRLVAQSVQQSRETMLAQNKASQYAAELLSKPQEQIDVQLAPDDPAAEIDENTGRRRTTRSSFMSAAQSSSGIKI